MKLTRFDLSPASSEAPTRNNAIETAIVDPIDGGYAEVTKDDANYPARNRCMFLLMLYSGMRVGEIAALDVGDVRDVQGKVRQQVLLKPHQTKGRHARTVLLNTQAQQEIERYLQGDARDAAQPLLLSKASKRFSANSLVQVFGRLYDVCGLDAATSHCTRRTFITNLAHKGVNVRVLAALAGHSSIATTQRYIDLNENVMGAAVELI